MVLKVMKKIKDNDEKNNSNKIILVLIVSISC